MADTVREAVAAFDSEQALDDAIDELERSEFDRSLISLLASEDSVEQKLGHHYRRVEEVEDDPAAPRVSFISRQAVHEGESAAIAFPLYVGATTAAGLAVAAGGPVGAAVVAAALGAGAGGILGGLLATWIGAHHADLIEEQIAHGGLVLWVQTPSPDREKRALEILKKHAAHDVHVHDVPAWAPSS